MGRRNEPIKFEFFIKPKGAEEFISREELGEEAWQEQMNECAINFGKEVERALSGDPQRWKRLCETEVLI